MARNPQQAAEKWARNLGGATEYIRQGVNNVTENPATKAIAKKQKMINNFMDAMQSGKWENSLGKVTLQDWKNSMLDKGIARISTGAQAAQGKYAAFLTDLFRYQESIKSQLDSMPDNTLDDSIARMTFWVRQMKNFRR